MKSDVLTQVSKINQMINDLNYEIGALSGMTYTMRFVTATPDEDVNEIHQACTNLKRRFNILGDMTMNSISHCESIMQKGGSKK